MNEAIQAVAFREPGVDPKTPPLLLFFFQAADRNVRESKGGPPVFDTVDYVRVVVAGSKGNEGPIYELARKLPDGSVKYDAVGMHRFRRPYEDWKAGRVSPDAGTPLEQWPLMDIAMCAAFKAANVFTVQQLATLSDGLLDTAIRRGGREWRAKAQAWLEEAKSAAGDVEARGRIAKLEEELGEAKKLLQEALRKQNTPGYDTPKRGRAKREDAEQDVDLVLETNDNRL